MNGSEAIHACHIRKTFGDFQALKDITISVPQGEIFGFIGKNGAGKTTFMRILCGLMKPTDGMLEVRQKISFLPQNARFKEPMSAGEMLCFFAALRGSNPGESLEFSKELELDVTRKVDSFSPGQQRKLQLVITTIGSPEILVLDEPTAGLDPSGVQQVRAIIKTLKQKGCTVFISSHVLMELENLCDSLAVIEKGELLYQGECSTVYEIETEGMDKSMLEQLPSSIREKFEVKGELLLAGIEKEEVPSVLGLLSERNIKVFGVKRQGIEALYNRLVKEGL